MPNAFVDKEKGTICLFDPVYLVGKHEVFYGNDKKPSTRGRIQIRSILIDQKFIGKKVRMYLEFEDPIEEQVKEVYGVQEEVNRPASMTQKPSTLRTKINFS